MDGKVRISQGLSVCIFPAFTAVVFRHLPSFLVVAGQLIGHLPASDGLHVVLLVEEAACDLDVLSFVRHDYDVVYEQIAELVMRHDREEGAECRAGFDYGAAEVEIFGL